MTGDGFYAMPEQEQINRLAGLARIALAEYGLEQAKVETLAYRENMTFAIDAGMSGRYALRVHQAGYRSDAQVQSELDFMGYLDGQGILTPQFIPANKGASFVVVEHADVMEPRQCDLFAWIDGEPLRRSAELPNMTIERASEYYTQVGRSCAAIYNASEKWQRPEGFERLRWDETTIFGAAGHLGDFRKIKQATKAQRRLMDVLAERVFAHLAEFGKSADRFGLSQGDLLAENIMVCPEGIRLIDFDDSGESWVMLDLATALFDIAGSAYFAPCLDGFVSGFRELKELPDEHLAMLPTFVIARLLSYVGHTVSRDHLEQSEPLQQYLLQLLEGYGTEYLQ